MLSRLHLRFSYATMMKAKAKKENKAEQDMRETGRDTVCDEKGSNQ
jgi:hypothetical protein